MHTLTQPLPIVLFYSMCEPKHGRPADGAHTVQGGLRCAPIQAGAVGSLSAEGLRQQLQHLLATQHTCMPRVSGTMSLMLLLPYVKMPSQALNLRLGTSGQE